MAAACGARGNALPDAGFPEWCIRIQPRDICEPGGWRCFRTGSDLCAGSPRANDPGYNLHVLVEVVRLHDILLHSEFHGALPVMAV